MQGSDTAVEVPQVIVTEIDPPAVAQPRRGVAGITVQAKVLRACSLPGKDHQKNRLLSRRQRRAGVCMRVPKHPVSCSDNIRSVIPEYPVT